MPNVHTVSPIWSLLLEKVRYRIHSIPKSVGSLFFILHFSFLKCQRGNAVKRTQSPYIKDERRILCPTPPLKSLTYGLIYFINYIACCNVKKTSIDYCQHSNGDWWTFNWYLLQLVLLSVLLLAMLLLKCNYKCNYNKSLLNHHITRTVHQPDLSVDYKINSNRPDWIMADFNDGDDWASSSCLQHVDTLDNTY